MSDRAGMICDAESVGTALAEARALNADIRAQGIAYGRPAEAVRALQWQQMALASEAVLGALDHFIRNGGGSRGARAIRDPEGEALPLTIDGPLEDYRFRVERDADRTEQIVVRLDGEALRIATRPNRPFNETRPLVLRARLAGLADWPDFRPGPRRRRKLMLNIPGAKGRRNRRGDGRDGPGRRGPLPPRLCRRHLQHRLAHGAAAGRRGARRASSRASAATGCRTPSSPRWRPTGWTCPE